MAIAAPSGATLLDAGARRLARQLEDHRHAGVPLTCTLGASGQHLLDVAPQALYAAVLVEDGASVRFVEPHRWPAWLRAALERRAAELSDGARAGRGIGPRLVPARGAPVEHGGEAGIRALVLAGDLLLALVGADAGRRLVARERNVLFSLIPPLRRRLLLEAGAWARAMRATWSRVLELLPGAAYVVPPAGGVLACNEAAGRLLAEDRAGVLAAVDGRMSGEPLRFAVQELPHGCGRPGFLVIAPARSLPLDERIARAAARWGLTRRQAAVLDHLARGLTNKEIAAALDCAEGTIESHFTQLFLKTGTDRRGALLVRFWQET